ncbi:hypothetical protein Nmel_015358, partial [Mimus melanotis]
MSSMKRAILSRLQPFLAWPRSRSEAAIKGQVTMNGTFQWNSIWHCGSGGMQIPGGAQGDADPRGIQPATGDAKHPSRMGMVQPFSASRSPRVGGCWKNIWMHPWIDGDKQGVTDIWGWAWRCCHSGRQEGLVQGERWGKGLAAASGCGIHPHIYSITVKQAKPVPAQSTAETAQHCPPLPSGAAPCDDEDSLGLTEGDGTAPSFPVTLFPHKMENPTGSQEVPSLFWLKQTSKLESKKGAGQRDPPIHMSIQEIILKANMGRQILPSFSPFVTGRTPLISPPGTTQLFILKTQTGL